MDIDEPSIGAETSVPSLEKRYTLHAKIYATRTSEGFRAQSHASGEEVLLWFLRHKLETSAIDKLDRRVKTITELDISSPKIKEHGVDSSGSAFLVTELVKGRPFFATDKDPKTLGAAFSGAVRSIARLHSHGISLGDICDQSFLVGGQGRVYLVALLGTFDVETKHTTMLPPQQTLHYLAPEQRAGVGTDPTCDVYALGVLGYRLFTGRFLSEHKPPTGAHEDPTLGAPAPSQENSDLPEWVDDILGKCLMMSTKERFNHAGELLSAISVALDSGHAPVSGGIWSRKTLIVRPNRSGVLSTGALRNSALVQNALDPEGEEEEDDTSAVHTEGQRKVLMFSIGLLISVFVAGIVYLFLEPWSFDSSPHLLEEAGELGELLPDHIRPRHTDIFSSRVSTERKLAALKKISEEDDPVIPLYVAGVASSTDSPRIRSFAEEILIDRAYTQKLPLAASSIESYFNLARVNPQVPLPNNIIYSNIAKATDLSLPPDTRQNALEKIYSEVPRFGKDLAASLSLDTNRLEFIRALRLIYVMDGRELPRGVVSRWPLILLDPQLSTKYGERFEKHIDTLSEQELAWSLLHFAKIDDPLLFSVAQATMDREIVPAFQEVFLNILLTANRSTMGRKQRVALASGARGEINREAINSLGRWYDINAESALLAICAIAQDQTMALDAFDTLSGRSVSTEPSRTLVEWIRKDWYDHRAKAAKSIGILGHMNIATEEQIDFAFNHLIPFSQGSSFITKMKQTGQPELIRRAVEVLGKLLQDEDLLPLLRHQNKEVRLAAVRALEGRNDLQVLQRISRACSAEKDSDVRAEYRRLHWVAKDCL